MDFLGLRTLTVIKDAVALVEKNHGVRIDVDHIDYNDNSDPDAVQIDYGDKKVLDAIGTGKCEGVFQLESAGMKNFMKELKPQSLEDVIAGISLYRPGPMDFIPKYIKGKNEPESITYDLQGTGTDPGADVRMYRLSGAGHADRAESCRLFHGTGG